MHMAREWWHLKMVIRASRSHDPAGVTATRKGECAVLCPACPHPGMNMEEGWVQVPDDRKFLHTLFLALDAKLLPEAKKCFKSKGRPGTKQGMGILCRGNRLQDPLEGLRKPTRPGLYFLPELSTNRN